MIKNMPPNKFGFGSQNYKLYSALGLGPLTSVEVARVAGLAHTRRLKDVEEYLEPLGWTIEKERISNDPVIYKYKLKDMTALF